jgi:hypothetical protein
MGLGGWVGVLENLGGTDCEEDIGRLTSGWGLRLRFGGAVTRVARAVRRVVGVGLGCGGWW